MKEDKKGNVGLIIVICALSVIALICIIVTVYLLVTGDANENNISPKDETKNKIENNVVSEEDVQEEVKKIDEAQGYIYEKEISIDNSYNMKIPVLNLTTKYATKINEDVEKNYRDTNGKYTVYSYYMYVGMVSLILDNKYNSGIHTYNIYNISTETGKEIKNEDLIKKLGISKEDVIAKAKVSAKAKFLEITPGIDENSERVKPCIENTIKEAEKIMDAPMYIDHTGKLCAVATIYQLAGATTCEYIIEL